MERVYWIEHNGIRIMFSDYSRLIAEDLAALSRRVDRELLPIYQAEIEPGTLLSLVDVTGSSASNHVILALKESKEKWYPLFKKQAVFGITPFQVIFLNAINQVVGSDIRSFKEREAALDWLVET